jgi:23S rRNA (cytosine1962-C5)-methyltransferase
MAFPVVTISHQAAKRVQHFDCWVFRDELTGPAPAVPDGEVVELSDPHGRFLGYAFYNSHSHIAARVVSTARDAPVDAALIRRRISAAIARRESITGTNARRLVFSESDALPGLIVDQYAEHLVLQVRTAGMERWRNAVLDALRSEIAPAGILERSDKEFRDDEGLPPLVQLLDGRVPDRIQIEEHGLRFWVDPHHGQKTGFYLDQRDTRRVVRELIQPGERVADVCAYTGAFSVGAASSGARVVSVEQQEPLLDLIRENARLNGVDDRIERVAADAFYWLEAKARQKERFDWVLLDPPSLAKSKADVLKGRSALHHLVVNALALLGDHGTLVLSLCTYHLLGVAEEILRIAAAERSARLRVLAVTMQAGDHPWILQMPATRYLMSWTARRDGSQAA